jgi:hypothetical protein
MMSSLLSKMDDTAYLEPCELRWRERGRGISESVALLREVWWERPAYSDRYHLVRLLA